jgi:hypothetical protein
MSGIISDLLQWFKEFKAPEEPKAPREYGEPRA